MLVHKLSSCFSLCHLPSSNSSTFASCDCDRRLVRIRSAIYHLQILKLSPAACAIVGSDLLEYIGECSCVDLLALVDGYCSPGFVVVPARNDTFGIGHYAPI